MAVILTATRCATQIVIYAGMALSLVPALTLQFFDDSKFLGPESDAIMSAVPSTGVRSTLTSD